MHMLYKVCRADSPQALCNDFKSESCREDRSYAEVQKQALREVGDVINGICDINTQLPTKKGATLLWEAARQGHVEAVQKILRHPKIDVNKVRLETNTTPLFIASCYGHEEVVDAILAHPNVHVNQGSINSGISPLYMAAQEGMEGVVRILLRHCEIDVNKPCSRTGVSPLCSAASSGHEHIVKILLGAKGINIHHTTEDGKTVVSIAASRGLLKTLKMLSLHPAMGQMASMASYPNRYLYDSEVAHNKAVADFCRAYCSDSSPKDDAVFATTVVSSTSWTRDLESSAGDSELGRQNRLQLPSGDHTTLRTPSIKSGGEVRRSSPPSRQGLNSVSRLTSL